MTETRSIDDYLKLPYAIQIIKDTSDNNPGWIAEVAELPGCFTQADTFAELEVMIYRVMRSWMEATLETGLTIPLPYREPERAAQRGLWG